jgi:hypothetical protein
MSNKSYILWDTASYLSRLYCSTAYKQISTHYGVCPNMVLTVRGLVFQTK